MRSVSPRKARTRTAAKPVPRGKGAPRHRGIVLGRSKKADDGFVARMKGAAVARLKAGRPMLFLTVGLLGFTAIAALFVGGAVGRAVKSLDDGVDAVVADAGFGIANLDIAGNRRTSKDTILAVLNIGKDQTTLSYDIHAAQARLARLPWVATASVRRRYPDALAVTLTEKHPFALWRTADSLFVIDRDGHVIARTNGLEFRKLPRFMGEAPAGGQELIAAIAIHRAVHARVWAMRRMGDRRWDLILDDQVVVQLPEEGWQAQLDELEHLLIDTGVLERDVEEIDLREPDNYFVRRHDGSQQTMPRGNAT
ncbi:MAG TPA: FtsQ-type POTRA domain-containing protein [Rhizomicrobium sp.]|jgi:cell division protein FtsQ